MLGGKKAQFPRIIFFSLVFMPVLFVYAQSKYSESISGLQKAYMSEMQAHRNYMAYAEKAKSENYPNIAHLFVSFAASESIHAHNMKRMLSDLGMDIKETPGVEVKVLSTKTNLKNALDFELKDIDHRYPEILEQIKPERNEAAIQVVTYAWESEKQHRDLIQKMRSGTGVFFGVLAERIEKSPARYFVCRICGSTVVELPKGDCPICKNSVSNYKEVERPK